MGGRDAGDKRIAVQALYVEVFQRKFIPRRGVASRHPVVARLSRRGSRLNFGPIENPAWEGRMDLAFTSEERQFADEVRAFVKANLPADIRDKVKNGKHLGRDDYMRWQQALGKQGWLVYTWPKKHGGPGFTPAQRYIFENICAEENAPGIIPFGTKMGGPGIYTFGNEAQKTKFLEPIPP